MELQCLDLHEEEQEMQVLQEELAVEAQVVCQILELQAYQAKEEQELHIQEELVEEALMQDIQLFMEKLEVI